MRLPAPGRFADGNDTSVGERKEWYNDRYGPDGKTWKDRWNWIDKDAEGISAIRHALQTMSSGRCAWCEKILQKGWPVDHLLPKADFPLVGYCPDNFLPACVACNRRKDTLKPPELAGKIVIDPVLADVHPSSISFVKNQLYPTLSKRLVDPSFDDPTAHIEFVAAALSFRGLTPEGEFTVSGLFTAKEDAKDWSKIHDWVHDRVTELSTQELPQTIFDKLISAQIEFFGQPTIFEALVKHWCDILIPASLGKRA